jgi:hypothetical protein
MGCHSTRNRMTEKKYLVCEACIFNLLQDWKADIGTWTKCFRPNCKQRPRCFDPKGELEFTDSFYEYRAECEFEKKYSPAQLDELDENERKLIREGRNPD